jgi:hypothetical protein
MHDPANDYNICPQCGTEFGNDDDLVSHAELRQRWIDGGGRFWWYEKEYERLTAKAPALQARDAPQVERVYQVIAKVDHVDYLNQVEASLDEIADFGIRIDWRVADGSMAAVKTLGQLAYERDLEHEPTYNCADHGTDAPRPTWNELPEIAREAWERTPTDPENEPAK